MFFRYSHDTGQRDWRIGRHNKVFLAQLFVHNKENTVYMYTIVYKGTIEHYKTSTAHCWMMIMMVDDDDANE